MRALMLPLLVLCGGINAADLSLSNGTIYRGVVVREITGNTLSIIHDGGAAQVEFGSLSSEWQAKLKPSVEQASQDAQEAAWQAKMGRVNQRQANETERSVVLTIAGPHKHGTLASYTVKQGKASRVAVVLVEGLQTLASGKTWKGTIEPCGTWAERSTDTVLARWRVKP